MKYTDTEILDFIEANYAVKHSTGSSLREAVCRQIDDANPPPRKLPKHGEEYNPAMFEKIPVTNTKKL